MKEDAPMPAPDFQGIGYSKIGYFKEARAKIKELEKLNLELARRHNRLEAIFNNMSDGLTILDHNLNIIYVNQVQQTLFSSEKLIGKKCYRTYFRKTSVCKNCPALKTLKNKNKYQGEIFPKAGNRHGRYYEWVTSPICDPSGHVHEIILLMRDITERKEYEYKSMQADRMAAIGFLAAGVAHEINNPLTSIAGFSEGLLKRFGIIENGSTLQQLQSFREYLNIINSEAYRCKDIIHNLQVFSLTTSDNFEKIKIDTIIKDTISLFRQRAKDQHIKINYSNHVIRGLDIIHGKESQLKHLFLNLVILAFKSAENGGNLEISSSNTGSKIKIVISGSGDSNYKREKRVDFSDKSNVLDYDINQSICYDIIRHHNGSIDFNDATEKGHCVTVHFPASVAPESSPPDQ